jgi:predicted amidohydrolase YtcJ
MGKSFVYLSIFALITAIFMTPGCRTEEPVPPADLVLTNGIIYTVNPEQPVAEALAVTGKTITAVFETGEEAEKDVGEETRVIDLKGQFVTPGIIDGHVHFNRAGALINDANLMTVSDEEGLRKEISRVVDILDDGEWITEGLWGAYEQWALGDAGKDSSKKKKPWSPHRAMIDEITPDNPVFICRYDYKKWLANTAALEAAGMAEGIYNGMEFDLQGDRKSVV